MDERQSTNRGVRSIDAVLLRSAWIRTRFAQSMLHPPKIRGNGLQIRRFNDCGRVAREVIGPGDASWRAGMFGYSLS